MTEESSISTHLMEGCSRLLAIVNRKWPKDPKRMIKRNYLPFTILSYQKFIEYMLIFTSSLWITIILFMNSHPQLYNQGSIKFKLCIKHFHNTQKNHKNDQKSTNKQKNTSSKVSSKAPVKKCEKKCKRHAFSMVRR